MLENVQDLDTGAFYMIAGQLWAATEIMIVRNHDNAHLHILQNLLTALDELYKVSKLPDSPQ